MSTAPSILFVDDEPDVEHLMRQKFRRQIREQQMNVFFSEIGEEALEMLKANPDIDLMVTDINMPRMDGLTLLSHVHTLNPILKTIIVSAYGDMDKIRQAMNRGAFDFITKPINFTDLEQTIDKTYKYVLQQRETLRAIRENDILKMYVDEDVIRFMSGKSFESALMSSEHIHASVMFVDIVGYTSFSERFPADLVVNMLNTYFDVMVQQIQKQHGVVDKFMGDCIMAVFRGENHLANAVDAGIAIREMFVHLRETEIDGYIPEIAIGINSGDMISGNIGSRTLKRLDYTVIGDIVNTAQRMQSSAKGGQILIGEASRTHLPPSYVTEETGVFSLKNKSGPMRLFNVITKLT
jgi:class 3 adenylate cyclase